MLIRNFIYILNFLNGAILAVIVSLVTFSLHFIGVFQLPDAVIYDLAVRYGPAGSAIPRVLLVGVDPEDRNAGDQTWLRVLDTLEKLEARQILFAFVPPNASPNFYRRALAMDKIVFGRGLVADPSGHLDEARLEPWPAAVDALERELPFGVVAVPPADRGIYRRQYAWYALQGQPYPALEARAASQLAGDRPPLPERSYWVNFRGGPAYLPMVTLQRLLRNGLIPELVRGRSVLIGLLPSPQTPSLHTPLDQPPDAGMTLLAFQGYALETLLRDQPIRPLSAPVVLAILAVVVFANLIVYQWGWLRFGLWVTGAFLAAYAASAWLALYAQRWPPVTALIVVQAAVFAVVFWHKSLVQDRALRSLVVDLASRSREQAILPGFYASPEPWNQVVELVRQTLDLGWLIFLERIPDQYYVREIAALNCRFADIDERRRDYRRVPYSDAVAERQTVRLEQRLFLKADSAIDQYMTPLLFGGELLGFWAMGVSPDKVAANPDFFVLVDDIRDQIAEMLYHRLQWQQQQTSQTSGERFRYLRLDGGENLHHALQQALRVFERRLLRLERVFQEMETAAIFYNPFGRVLQANEAMAAILRQGQLPAYEMTALDLLSTLCGIDLSEGRQALRRVFVDHQTVTLPADVPGDTRHRYTLRAQPVLAAEGARLPDEAAEALPFQLQGVLIELFDVTTLHNLSLVKTELTARVHEQLRDHLQAMVLATDLREAEQSQERGRQSVRLILRQQVETAVALLNRAQKYLLTDLIALQQFDRYPVEPRAPLRAALAELSRQMDERQVRTAVDMPELLSLVMADSDALREALETLLAVLIEDAMVGSQLTIKLREQAGWLVYELRNQGFGMPNAKFQSWLGRDDSEATPLFRRLRAVRRRIVDWQGVLQGSSALGDGVRFVLRLPCFGGEERGEGDDTTRSQLYLAQAENKRILVVDDSKMIQRLVTWSLRKEGYDARAAADGQRAIAVLQAWMPDLIVLDMMMPVMDGLQFLEWRNQYHPRLPVLALTGMERPDVEEQILAAGADAVLFKPMHVPELLAKVKRLLDLGDAPPTAH
ncbi:MAG TPA: response regulator [Candidatus Competibacter sp.]|nr:response regulator [Candidatus Competibacter sp.]